MAARLTPHAKPVANPKLGNLEIPADIERQLLATETILVSQLIIDKNFQRDLDFTRANKMAREWNWLACGPLVVSLRQGGTMRSNGKARNIYSVLDGQQRLHAIKLLGFKEAPCRIYCDLTEKQEAELFELLNKAKLPTFNDLFKSRMVRGEEVASAINAAVKSVGWELDPERRHTTPRHIQTMKEMESLYHLGKAALIMDTLRFINDIWPRELLGQQAMIISGIGRFLNVYGKEVDLKSMKEKMARIGQIKMVQQAFQYGAARGRSSAGSRGLFMQEAMLMLYNSNRKDEYRVKSKF